METIFTSLKPWLALSYWGNTVQDYLIALGILLVFWIFFRFVKARLFRLLSRITKKTKSRWDNEVLKSFEKLPRALYFFAALFIALQVIEVDPLVKNIVQVCLTLLVIYWLSQVTSRLAHYGLRLLSEKRGDKKDEENMSGLALVFALKFVLWTIGLLLILSNLGVNISALIASLGIGGIAVALAVQNILGDMFSSFTIYLDKPFEIGDYIVVGEHSGTVKKIGLKSTRIQALQGEEIVISNKELTTARVQNFKRMKKRRIAFEFDIAPETQSGMLSKVPGIVETIIQKHELADFTRAHFKTFVKEGFRFEVVYQMQTSEYKDYMDTQQQINLDLLEVFEKEKIHMAFVPSGLFVEK